MSTFTELGAERADDAADVISDRRQGERYQTTYRPCCIIIASKVTMGLIRNYSVSGAKIEVDADLKVGDKVRYFWEADSCIPARVVWRDGKTYGIEHTGHKPVRQSSFPLRSVRVPCEAEASCWINGQQYTGFVENISIGGMRIVGLPPLQPGALLSISLCGLELDAVSVRWADHRRLGLRFSQRLTREMLAQLLLDERFGLSNIEFASHSVNKSKP